MSIRKSAILCLSLLVAILTWASGVQEHHAFGLSEAASQLYAPGGRFRLVCIESVKVSGSFRGFSCSVWGKCTVFGR